MRRRNVLALGTAGIASLAGCSGLGGTTSATVDRIVLRSDTGQREAVELTLVYAPCDDSTERPLWGTYEAPGSGEETFVEDFESDQGFYSLTAYSQRHDNIEVVSLNTNGDAVDGGQHQFEVVIREGGDVWVNLNEKGATIPLGKADKTN